MKSNRELFLNGIENLKYIGKKEQLNASHSFKFFVLYTAMCLVAKRQATDGKLFFLVGTEQVKKTTPVGSDCTKVYSRKFSTNLKELRNRKSIVSSIPKYKRFEIILNSIFTAPRSGHYVGRWLEYQLLCSFFEENVIESAVSFGHYDEFTVWLTELCAKYSVPYTMVQHGIVLEKIHIPHKINCKELYVYNKYSERVFRDIIIKNADCHYNVVGFKTNLSFQHLEREEGKKYIGVVDQTFPEWLDAVVSQILRVKGYVAVIMLHPLSKECSYLENNDVIVTREKYDNLDCVISDFSTLILDYISSGYPIPIICTNEQACNEVFAEYGLKHISIDDLQCKLGDYINE